MINTSVAIRQTLQGVSVHSLNKDGSYETCLLDNNETTGDVLFIAEVLRNLGFGTQFRLDRVGNECEMNAPVVCSGLVFVKNIKGEFEWTAVPFDSLIGVPSFKN